MNQTSVFWPIARNHMQLRFDDGRDLTRFRSLVTYQLLFAGKLVIRDTDYLGNFAFRTSLLESLNGSHDSTHQYFRSLVDNGMIQLACREGQQIGHTAESLYGKGHNPSMPREWHTPEFPDIQYLDQSIAPAFTYSIHRAGLFYATNIQRLLANPTSLLPDNFRKRLSDLVAFEVEQREGFLSWSFLAPQSSLWNSFSRDEFEQCNDFVYRVLGQAPYTASLMEQLRLDPVYMADASDAVDFWRGRLGQPTEMIEERSFKTRGFSLSQYVDCLSVLSVDDLQRLLASDEAVSFFQASELFAVGKCSVKELESAISGYRRRVDSQIMLRRLVKPLGSREEFRVFRQEVKNETVTETVNVILQEAIGSVPFWRLGYSVFYRLCQGEWPSQRDSRIRREECAESTADLIHSSQLEDEIQMRVTPNSGGVDRLVSADVKIA